MIKTTDPPLPCKRAKPTPSAGETIVILPTVDQWHLVVVPNIHSHPMMVYCTTSLKNTPRTFLNFHQSPLKMSPTSINEIPGWSPTSIRHPRMVTNFLHRHPRMVPSSHQSSASIWSPISINNSHGWSSASMKVPCFFQWPAWSLTFVNTLRLHTFIYDTLRMFSTSINDPPGWPLTLINDPQVWSSTSIKDSFPGRSLTLMKVLNCQLSIGYIGFHQWPTRMVRNLLCVPFWNLFHF